MIPYIAITCTEQALLTAKEILGPNATDFRLARLGGALDGFRCVIENGQDPKEVRISIRFDEGESQVRGSRLLRPDRTLYISSLTVDPPNRGVATRISATHVQYAQLLGIKKTLIIARGHGPGSGISVPRQNGYYIFPKFGYDGNFQRWAARVKGEQLPDMFRGISTLQQLLAMPQGEKWWREFGGEMQMEFDFTPGSDSLRIHNAYVLGKDL